ncbi:ExbD/TolR family protein [Taibaiella koreensis]|uniref:ExbD/TolR family protein n=1 Tax=Taibaiella koreensis TaxID=1268548 RepID=UPI0013C37210|nr:biopolymer transporter ExbD [Taibaiella koreensis]
MAELLITAGRGRRQRSNPRIDLTPMVDLGFLLITFFMLTTTMTKPKAMDIQMPFTPAKSTTAFYESSAITLMPAKDHRIYYYEGLFQPGTPLKEVHTEATLRSLLQHKQQALRTRPVASERQLQVLIKAHSTATVADIIGLFDEMNILGVRQVGMVDIGPEEAAVINTALR